MLANASRTKVLVYASSNSVINFRSARERSMLLPLRPLPRRLLHLRLRWVTPPADRRVTLKKKKKLALAIATRQLRSTSSTAASNRLKQVHDPTTPQHEERDELLRLMRITKHIQIPLFIHESTTELEDTI